MMAETPAIVAPRGVSGYTRGGGGKGRWLGELSRVGAEGHQNVRGCASQPNYYCQSNSLLAIKAKEKAIPQSD